MAKIRIMMKDPDCLDEPIGDAAEASVAKMEGLDDDEKLALAEKRAEKLRELCARWFEYGEYATIEVDTDALTARVVPVKEANGG